MSSFLKIPKLSGEPYFSRHNIREELGYGKLSNKFHKSRAMPGNFPFPEKDSLENIEWTDEESEEAISKKIKKTSRSDFFSRKSVNPFYFVAGNTKLSDCFYRIEHVLEGIHALSDSMTTLPNLYKKRLRSSIGSSTSMSTISKKSFKKTGSKKGFSSPPPVLKYDKKVNDETESIFNLDDLVKKLQHESCNFQHYR